MVVLPSRKSGSRDMIEQLQVTSLSSVSAAEGHKTTDSNLGLQ